MTEINRNQFSNFDFSLFNSRFFDSRIFEFDKKEDVVQKNLNILNNYYKTKYRRHTIKNILSKSTFDEYFKKISSKTAQSKDPFFKNNLLMLPRHLRFSFQQKLFSPTDYKELIVKTNRFYLLKKLELRSFLKKVDKNKLGIFEGSFFLLVDFRTLILKQT